MHFERFLADNVGHLGHCEYHFAIGPRQLRKWILLPADASSGALLRALALGGMGRLRVQNLPHGARAAALENLLKTRVDTVAK
jgi:hypothetical protein